MKKLLIALVIAGISFPLTAKSFTSPGVGGPSGLIGTPTANTTWGKADIAVDAGAHASFFDGTDIFTYKANLTIVGPFEVGAAYNSVNRGDADDSDEDDILSVHSKFRFLPLKGGKRAKSSLAIGYFGGFTDDNNSQVSGDQHQVYLAATFGSDFFGMASQTSMAFGKTFGDTVPDEDLDFSLGFNVELLPQVFDGYIHWINDFANYNYVGGLPHSGSATYRAAYNTGARIAVLKEMKTMRLDIDVLALDALDDSRGFGIGATFGMPFDL